MAGFALDCFVCCGFRFGVDATLIEVNDMRISLFLVPIALFWPAICVNRKL